MIGQDLGHFRFRRLIEDVRTVEFHQLRPFPAPNNSTTDMPDLIDCYGSVQLTAGHHIYDLAGKREAHGDRMRGIIAVHQSDKNFQFVGIRRPDREFLQGLGFGNRQIR